MRRLLAAVAIVAGVLLVGRGAVGAQTPPVPPPMGVISGTVHNGTAGAITPVLTIDLIAVPPSGQITQQSQQTQQGAFRFDAPADSTVTYLLRTDYAGVPYLDATPVLISREAPTVQRELTVWETTTVRPALHIDQTTVDLQAVDANAGQVELSRDDEVVNPTDRVYIGEADHTTLRIPAPDGVTDVAQQQRYDATATLDQQTIVTTQPLRPGTNSVVTRMLATFDTTTDAYTVRATAPLDTASMAVRTPASLVRTVKPAAGSAIGKPTDEAGTHWLVAERSGPARQGEGMIVTLDGVGGAAPPNPLTSAGGAAAAVGVSLGVLVAGFAALTRMRRLGGEATA